MKFNRDNSGINELTQEKIDARRKAIKAQANYINDSQKYVNRKRSYPSLGDQLDMLWHDMDEGRITVDKTATNTWYNAIKNIRETNPL